MLEVLLYKDLPEAQMKPWKPMTVCPRLHLHALKASECISFESFSLQKRKRRPGETKWFAALARRQLAL